MARVQYRNTQQSSKGNDLRIEFLEGVAKSLKGLSQEIVEISAMGQSKSNKYLWEGEFYKNGESVPAATYIKSAVNSIVEKLKKHNKVKSKENIKASQPAGLVRLDPKKRSRANNCIFTIKIELLAN